MTLRLTTLLFAGLFLCACETLQPSAPQPGVVGIGLQPMAGITAEQKGELGVKGDHGSVVASVAPDGPAAKAGIRPGDFLLRFAGWDVPDLTLPQHEAHHLWYVSTHLLLEHLWAGQEVKAEIERAGQKKTVTIRAISKEQMHRLQKDPSAAAMGPCPSPATGGAPAPFSVDFETTVAAAPLPAGFHPYEGLWTVVPDPGKAGNHVLKQGRTTQPWAQLLISGKGRAFGDGRISVRFMPLSGVEDASGGIIFRAKDPLNYYVIRSNADEDNYTFYMVKDGARSVLKEQQATAPKKHTWHTMEVTFRGDDFRATVDGKDLVEVHDSTFASGWCGLWTKADSKTLFDDYRAEPLGGR